MNLLNIASTYYTKVEEEHPKFLMDGIRKHAIFKSDIQFWEACILHKTLNMKQMASHSAFCDGINQSILAVAFHMNDIFDNKLMIKSVCMKYVNLYKIGEKSQMIMSYLNKIEKNGK